MRPLAVFYALFLLATAFAYGWLFGRWTPVIENATLTARCEGLTVKCEQLKKQRDAAEANWFAIADRPLTPTPPPMPCCSEPVAVAPSPEPAPVAPPCDYCGDRCPCLVCGCGIAAKPVPQPVVVLGQISVPSYQTPPPGCAWVLYSDRVWRLVCQPAPVVVTPRPAVVIGFRVGGRGKR